MKVKHKLFISLLFLFTVILLLGGVGVYYLRWLADDSEAILKNNYRTLDYVKKMEESADQIYFGIRNENLTEARLKLFWEKVENNLLLQNRNITEPGELELTEALQEEIVNLGTLIFTSAPRSQENLQALTSSMARLKAILSNIYLINEKQILIKNEAANATARKVVVYMGIIALTSILLGLLYIIWLPKYISKPLVIFNDAIKQVAQGNYKIQIPDGRKDEYGELAASFNRMALRLDEYEHSNLGKLIKEQRRLNAVIDQMDEVILGLDENKNILFANRHCLKLFDLKPEDVKGKYAPDLALRKPLLGNLIQDLNRDGNGRDGSDYATVKVLEDNREKLFSKTLLEISGNETGSGSTSGYLVVLHDITSFAEKDKAKTHFMSTLSHELKTPVAAVKMAVGLLLNLRSGTLNQQQQELLETVAQNNQRIAHTINEVLNLSRIESGTIDVQLADEDPKTLVETAIEGVRLFLNEKELSIERDFTGLNKLIKVDAHKTVWVLNNFLTNAIRYAPPKSAIAIRGESLDGFVRLTVTDRGSGIAFENQEKIFQKFNRLSDTKAGGTGLGLAISREFMEAMGGEIGLSSRLGMGASFWIKCRTAPI